MTEMTEAGPSNRFDITIDDYVGKSGIAGKSFVIRGDDTKRFKDQLRAAGGKFNPMLDGGPGWIFSVKKKEEIQVLLDQIQGGDIKGDQPTSRKINIPGQARTQAVTYTFPRPNQKSILTILSDGISAKYHISSIETHDGIVDTIFIFPDGKPMDIKKAVVVNGKWQIWCHPNEHSITFS